MLDGTGLMIVFYVLLSVTLIFYVVFYLGDLYIGKLHKRQQLEELEELRKIIDIRLKHDKRREEAMTQFLKSSYSKHMINGKKKYYNETKLEDGVMQSNTMDGIKVINKEEKFIDRLVEEQEGLADRMDKLDAFISTDRFIALKAEPQFLLTQQLKAMDVYHSILVRRLELLGVAVES